MEYVPSRLYAKGPEIFAHCQAIARSATTSTTWPCSAPRSPRPSGTTPSKLWHARHRPRRHDEGQVRDLRQRHAVQAQAVEDRRHGDASRATPSTPRAGTTPTPARTCREPVGQGRRHHRHRRVGGAGDPAARRRRPRNSTSSSARRRASTSATTGRPIRSGQAGLKPGWQEARRDEGTCAAAKSTASKKAELAALSARGEDPPPGERQHRPHDAHPRAHRGNRRGQGDRRGAEALVHVHVQAAVLRRRLSAGLQPAERPSGRHPRQGHHRDRARRARCSRARPIRSTC